MTVRRVEVQELLSEAVVRTFHCDLSQLPEWFRPALEFAQPVLGFGTIDPLELRIDGSRMTSVSPGFGKTLVEHYKERALRAFELENFDESQEYWEEALRHDWLDLAVHNNSAVTKAASSKWQEAAEQLEAVQKHYGFHPLVDTNLALCKHHLEEPIDCHFRLRRTISLNPNFAQAHRLQAQIAFQSGSLKTASESILQALRSSPQCRRARLVAAEILGALGQEKEAEIHRRYAETLPIRPDLFDHLISDNTPAPWTLYLNGQDNTLFHRVNLVKWPRLPIEDFWRWLYEGEKI